MSKELREGVLGPTKLPRLPSKVGKSCCGRSSPADRRGVGTSETSSAASSNCERWLSPVEVELLDEEGLMEVEKKARRRGGV